MDKIKSSLQDVFAKNRAEEIGYDVWERFVIPPFFDKLDVYTARKPRVIIGGRGCGKTMLLRYLSHQSIFSKNREIIPKEAIQHIGLYWKADTQFCNIMINRSVQDDTWQSAFNHYAAFTLGKEVLSSIRSIAESVFSSPNKIELDKLDFKFLKVIDNSLPVSYKELYNNLESRRLEFSAWVNDVRKRKEPLFLPGRDFVQALINILKEQVSFLSQATFFVYLDEYENLCDYQQEIINTWLKTSEVPLIFNLAMKRNAFQNKNTLGQESLADIHDLRTHDLEEYILSDGFDVFAGEILFLQLSFLLEEKSLPINLEDLRNPNALAKRNNAEYRKKIISETQKYLPDIPQKELAQDVFDNDALSAKLYEHIQKALKYRNCKIKKELFFQRDIPEASIITPALLYRDKLKPQEILDEMEQMRRGLSNRFTGSTNWIHNNFIGCLLQLYAPNARICPFYGGFQTFCSLSRGNIRHFLELCHKSFKRASIDEDKISIPVSALEQAEAARQASTAFLGEVRSFGQRGNQLHAFVMRLGSLFSLAAQRLTQSESEQSHFSITKGMEELSSEHQDFLREATKWSVLIEYRDTKRKDDIQPETIEYILNPIYTPYFYISYRKKRRLELSVHDVICLISGRTDEFKKLMKNYYNSWSVNDDDLTLPLSTLFKEETVK